MYETYGVRPADFRTLWPNQLKTLFSVAGELQSQALMLQESSLHVTQAASVTLDQCNLALSSKADDLIARIEAAQVSATQDIANARTGLIDVFKTYLREHQRLQDKIAASSRTLSDQEDALKALRRTIMDMPWYSRVWAVLTRDEL
jgi:phage shock protein A